MAKTTKPTRNLTAVIPWTKSAEVVTGSKHEEALQAMFFRDGRVHVVPHGRFRADKFTLDDVAAVSLDTPEGGVARVSSGARTAGGAVVGGVLLGPAGLIAGAVVGNAAKRTEGGRPALSIFLHDGRQYTVIVKPQSVATAERMIRAIVAQIDA